MHVASYLSILHAAEKGLAESFRTVADRHQKDFETYQDCKQFADWSEAHAQSLEPFMQRYGQEPNPAPEQLRGALFHGVRIGPVGLLHDMQDLLTLANSVRTNWTILHQASMQLKDKQLEDTASSLGDQTNRQIDWLCTRVKVISPQALTGPTDVAAEMKAAIPKKQNPSSVPEPLWAPAVAGLLTAVVGIASVIAGQPWLFPSLGPTAYLQAEMPAHPASKLYNVVVGHLVGLIAGFASVFLFNALNEPSVLQDHRLTAMRAAAAVLAIVLTMLVAHLLRANHPPAGATTLLVALGALKTLNDGVNLMIGVVIIAVVGEVLRSMRIGKVATRVPAKARVPANAGR